MNFFVGILQNQRTNSCFPLT